MDEFLFGWTVTLQAFILVSLVKSLNGKVVGQAL